jgi:hypothetical protein
VPRYYFDIKDGEDLPDDEGAELADLGAARLEAVRYSAEVLREMPERFWNCEEWTMTVREGKVPQFSLKFLAETLVPG